MLSEKDLKAVLVEKEIYFVGDANGKVDPPAVTLCDFNAEEEQ